MILLSNGDMIMKNPNQHESKNNNVAENIRRYHEDMAKIKKDHAEKMADINRRYNEEIGKIHRERDEELQKIETVWTAVKVGLITGFGILVVCSLVRR